MLGSKYLQAAYQAGQVQLAAHVSNVYTHPSRSRRLLVNRDKNSFCLLLERVMLEVTENVYFFFLDTCTSGCANGGTCVGPNILFVRFRDGLERPVQHVGQLV